MKAHIMLAVIQGTDPKVIKAKQIQGNINLMFSC